MRRRLAVAALLAALPLAGCGGSAGSAAGDPTSAAAQPVELQRSGGIAGTRDAVTVQPDGSWRRTGKAGTPTTGTLSADQRDRLTRMAGDPALPAEATRPRPGIECADAFNYRVVAGGTTVAWQDCGTATDRPVIASDIAALLLNSTE
jgi:hypothetical protein